MTQTAASRSVVIEKEFAHPPQKVWRALTEGPLIDQWLLKSDFQPVVGHRFKFHSPAMPPHWDGLIDCEVLTVDPPSRLAYSWSALGLDSTVTWTLTPTANGTKLRMEHAGFRPEQEQAYKGANYGWQNFIGKLEQTIASLQ
jgi:uncharacterized protein YndB with AHSA1/START domain